MSLTTPAFPVGQAHFRNGKAGRCADGESPGRADVPADRFAELIAIAADDCSITYHQLESQANQLAHWLRDHGLHADDRVGLLLEKSPEALVTILAAWKAGVAYVPFDPVYPAERCAVMAEDAAPALVITTRQLAARLAKATGPVMCWEDLAPALAAQPTDPLAADADDDNLGYVLFTSGSTGRPKGVAMRRGPLRNLIAWQSRNSTAGPGDATVQFASLSFDVSFQEVFSTWVTGGCLVLPSAGMRTDPAALARFIADNSIRRLFLPFVMLQQLAEAATEPPTCLREVITAGEQLQITPAVRRFFSALPGCSLHNHYGPTEAHVVTAYALPGPASDWPTLPPIGRAIDGAKVYLLKDGGEAAAPGDTAEIWIGGDCLARGYIGRPDLTAERFQSDPFSPGGRMYRTGDLGRWDRDGWLHYLGRCDDQLKVRGYRVEPGEIEIALCGHEAISEAAVVAREDVTSGRRLVAYFVAKSVPPPRVDELRVFLARRLPDYMIPATFVPLDALPLTPSGKVDRKALPAPSQVRPALAAAFVPPRSELERAIAGVWREVLQLDAIGVQDGFFELGGNSLALARVHARLRERLVADLPLAAHFQYPTIAQLAAALEGQPKVEISTCPPIASPTQPIAIIGLAGRFPGAGNVEEFWNNLCLGVETVSFFSDDELRAAGIPEDLLGRPDYVKARGVLADADCFDADFFSYQPAEAALTDPQQRVFLETCWTALEHAGYVPDGCTGRVGVFAGASLNTYLLNNVLSRPGAAATFVQQFQSAGYPLLVGNDKDYLSTRVAYKLNLRGPAVAVQTACSTSLVAVCEAVSSLRAGRCDVALAGGVSVTFPQKRGSLYQDGAITSPDGRCRPFDADARGTVFGEGVAVIVLKRLDNALADGDTVYAVIKGIGLSNDGANKVSFLAPGVDGQADAVRAAIADAGVEPSTIGYVEAHGTGTPMGDPVEVAALARSFGPAPPGSCVLGSVKSNIGHLEAAAGITGLIKAALALKHRRIPPTLHFRQPNPSLELDRTPFRVSAETVEWHTDGPRRAGVTSLGVGGTNAHVVLEEAPPLQPSAVAGWPCQLLVWSARTPQALDGATTDLSRWLEDQSDIALRDVAYTMQVGRRAFQFRRMAVVRPGDDAAAVVTGEGSRGAGPVGPATVVFLFPGQGSQAAGMTAGLYNAEPTFRASLDLCADLVRPHVGQDLRDLIFSDNAGQIDQTRFAQPALFAVEYALAQMWFGWGVRPAAMLGHSIGEFVAACLAGVFSLGDALKLVARRGELVQACQPGVMLAIRAREADVIDILPAGLDIAAINGPMQCVVSGAAVVIADFERELAARNIQSRRLNTSHAFHSALLEPAVGPFRNAVAEVGLVAPRIPFISCVSGRPITDAEATNPDYWAGQVRRPVRLNNGLAAVTDQPAMFLEVGPGRTLTNLARQCLPSSRVIDAIAGLDPAKPDDDVFSILSALGRLWLGGIEPDWQRFHATTKRRRVALPTYPFERQRHWIEPYRESAAPIQRDCAAAETAKPKDLVARPHSPDESAAQVCDLFAELAGLNAGAIDPAATFFDLGFDSLFLTQAVQAVQVRFGVRVTFRQLLEDLSTPRALAGHIAAYGTEKTIPQPTVPPTAEEHTVPVVDQVAAVDWSGPQRRFIQKFTRRYAAKTAGSKRHVQDHRREHADPRTASGFSPLWKEIVYPLVVGRSAGSRIWDIDGNEYIDLLNGFGPDLLGHSPPLVVEAVEAQLRTGYEGGPLSPQAGELARLLCEMTGLDRASFVCTGSEAVQAALRAARTVTGRDKVVTFSRDYHGNFDEVLLRAGAQCNALPSAPGIPRSAVSNMIVLDYGTGESLDVIRRLGPELAAVLVEPVQSRRPDWQPRDFLHELRKLTDESAAALIFDEVITGFRLHPGGAQAVFGVRADLATYGKVVGGGLPIGVVAGRSKFMDVFDGGWWQYGDDSQPTAGRTFFAGTFVRHPLALAAGLATLRHLQTQGPGLQERLNARTDGLVKRLNEVARAHGVPLEVVNCGSLMYFRVAEGAKEAGLLFHLLRERGVYLLEGFPSYLSTAHTDADIDAVVTAFRESAAEMRAHGFFGAVAALASNDHVPLTAPQQELWLAAQAGDDASRAFNETCTIRLSGPFQEGAFRQAVRQLVERHEALRSVFDLGGTGQRFLDAVALDVPLVDLSDLTAAQRDERLSALQDNEDCVPFDLARGPLLRLTVVRLATEEHRILLTAHHIACDGWSYDVVLRELAALYTAAVGGTAAELPPASRFSAYAAEQAQRLTPDLRHWTALFTPPPNPIELPTDHPRPPQRTFRGARVSRTLGHGLTTRVRQAAARLGCTPYSLLRAAFDAWLARLTGQTDVVVGIPTAGQTWTNTGSLVGHCVHFLPMRQRVDQATSFASLAADVKAALLSAFDHHDFTYGSLLRAMPANPNGRPLVSVSFNLDPKFSDLHFGNSRADVIKNPKHFVNLELHWNLVDAGSEYVLEAEYNTDLFEGGTVAEWTAHFAELLSDAVSDPHKPVGGLRIMSEPQRRQVVVEWNDTARPFPSRGVHELFEDQARIRPEAPAILFGDHVTTYGELNRRANRLAHRLQAAGVAADVAVGVLLPRSPDLIVALLAILKAGGAYLPLEPSHPESRNRRLLELAKAPTVIADTEHTTLGKRAMTVDSHAPADDFNLNLPAAPPQLAAVMFTSGSTGEPKGVMVTHGGIARLLFNAGYCEFGPHRTFAALAPIAFDASTFEIWGALLHGGRLALYPEAVPDPTVLGPFLKRHSVDTLWLTAGLFNAVVDHDVNTLAGVRQLLTGGEAMSIAHARRALAALPEATIINGYGPTEAATFTATFPLPRDLPPTWPSVPVGRPIGNTVVLVLDERRSPVPVGVPGELYVGGPGVARGYINDAGLTAHQFVPSPVPEHTGTFFRTGDRGRWRPDGKLEFLGRLDDQVKIRGQRVEPGEIEGVLARHPDVIRSAVVVQDTRLVAYVVGKSNDENSLRGFLADRLPAVMMPSTFVFLDALPLTANGKLDRAALPRPTARPPVDRLPVAPRTDAERDLLAVWTDVLDDTSLGITDNFFDVGGHSLKAIQLVAAVHDRLGHTLPLSTLYQAPTVERFAAVIQNRLEAGPERSLVPLQTAGHRAPLFLIAGVGGHVFAFHKFARMLGPDQPAYGVKAVGVDGTRPPPETVAAIAAVYVREITAERPCGPYVLAGYSLGASIAFEVALRLRARGDSVPLLVAFDAAAPEYLTLPVWRRAALHVRNLALHRGRWAYVKQRFHNLRDRLNWAIGRGERNAPRVPGLEMYSRDAITQVWVALHKAYHDYQPAGRFDGNVLVIRADVVDDWDKFAGGDPLLGWQRWTTGHVTAVGLPVRHLDLFHEPAISDVAGAVSKAISEVLDNR